MNAIVILTFLILDNSIGKNMYNWVKFVMLAIIILST